MVLFNIYVFKKIYFLNEKIIENISVFFNLEGRFNKKNTQKNYYFQFNYMKMK